MYRLTLKTHFQPRTKFLGETIFRKQTLSTDYLAKLPENFLTKAKITIFSFNAVSAEQKIDIAFKELSLLYLHIMLSWVSAIET